MLTRAAGAIHQQMFRPQLGYPYKVWGLLDCPAEGDRRAIAQQILFEADCTKDEWTLRFLKRFSTVDLLVGSDCLATLMSIGIATVMDIGAIECRHASIRRIARARSQTHRAPFSRASADFYLARQFWGFNSRESILISEGFP